MKKLFLFTGILLMIAFITNAQNIAKRAVNLSSTQFISLKSLSATPQVATSDVDNTPGAIQRKDGTMENLAWLMQQDPTLQARMQVEENKFNDYISSHQSELENNKTAYTLPVVVHLVYKSIAGTNNDAGDITDAMVAEQIVQTNKDWAGTNGRSMQAFASSLRANSQITLCLAKKDASGNACTGVVRTVTTVTSFSTNNAVKTISPAWAVTKFLNIWVCDMQAFNNGYCGYAQFPTSGINSTYGVVIDYKCFGLGSAFGGTSTTATAPFNGGGTVSHEFGHCFNLAHIWGDDGGGCTETAVFNGSDGCSDTPNQADACSNNGIWTGVHTDACTTTSPGIMYMNFMDYSDDIKYANVTPNQVTRMQSAVGSYLTSVNAYSATACTTTTPTLSVSSSTLTGFTYVLGSGPSASQSYNLSGTNLTGFPSNITVTAPTHYEVSLSSGSGYATSVSVAYTSATLASKTIYVRLKAGLAVASYNSEIVANAGGGATTVNVTCSGSVTATATPTLTVSSSTLSGFTYVTGNGPSASQSYNLSGTNLTGFPSNITVTAPTHYEVSLSSGSGYATSVSVAYTSATLASKTIYVRLKAGLAVASYNSEIVANAGGGATTVNVTCSGSVTDGSTTTTCDTLDLMTSGLDWYSWCAGTNSYNDAAKANYFASTTAGYTIKDIYVQFIYAVKTTGSGYATVAVWNNSGTAGVPGSTPIAQVQVPLSTIVTDVNNSALTHATLASAVNLTGPCYVGVILPTTYATGDTVVLLADTSANAAYNVAWELWGTGAGGGWYAFSDANSWGVPASLAIYPVLCTTTVDVENLISDKDISVYPNPAQNEFTVDFSGYKPTDATIEVYNMIGKLVKSASSNGLTDKMSIDMSNQTSGIYIVNIKTDQGTVIKKLSLIK